jgi:hypothetical protein
MDDFSDFLNSQIKQNKVCSENLQTNRKENLTDFLKDPIAAIKKAEQEEKDSIQKAILLNNWNPNTPTKKKSGHYLDPKELFFRVAKVKMCDGDFDKAGRDGDRLVELLYLLSTNYLGKICFKDQGHMSNFADDLIQEGATKCCLVVNKFSVWDRKTQVPETKLNNAFAYFTTVLRNKMYETMDSSLSGTEIYLEDLKTENQSVGDLI